MLVSEASSWTLSVNLYVSQHTSTGILLALARAAIMEFPVRECMSPIANMAAAPRNTLVVCGNSQIVTVQSIYVDIRWEEKFMSIYKIVIYRKKRENNSFKIALLSIL